MSALRHNARYAPSTCPPTVPWRSVDLLVDEVLDRRSVALAAPGAGIEEPQALRGTNGSSVYTVAGADLYTSQRILDAEARLVAAAGRHGGASVEQAAVDLALLEMAANGTALDPGQAALVSQMCTSGARLQLAIAPAGAGKTTAMRALSRGVDPRRRPGGRPGPVGCCGRRPREQTRIRTDTLAKLTWSLQHGDLPDWAAAIGPSTLVIIDEAGMADTSPSTPPSSSSSAGVRVCDWSVMISNSPRSAPAASSATSNTPTARCSLTELHRFTDPAEAAASLALRDGDPGRSSSTSITAGSMSATWPPPPGAFTAWAPTGPRGSTQSCSPPPASWSPNSTPAPARTGSTAPQRS